MTIALALAQFLFELITILIAVHHLETSILHNTCPSSHSNHKVRDDASGNTHGRQQEEQRYSQRCPNTVNRAKQIVAKLNRESVVHVVDRPTSAEIFFHKVDTKFDETID